MWWHHPADTWIAGIAALAAAACAMPGTMLVMRRMGMLGDAVSHAVLPGIVLGFLLAAIVPHDAVLIGGIDPRHPFVMLPGAIIAGTAAALLIGVLTRVARTERGAATGIVLTGFFALGLLLIRLAADSHRVDLDPDCVLYGSLELARLDTWRIGSFDVPRAAVVLGVAAMFNAVILFALQRPMAATAFDAEHATAGGVSARRAHTLLMVMTAVTVVLAFEAVGSILVIALLIVPAAAARLLTDRFGRTFMVAAVIGAAGAFIGHAAAISVPRWFGLPETLSSGSIAVVLGLIMAAAVVLSPVIRMRSAEERVDAHS